MAIVFYASETKLTDEHAPVIVKGFRNAPDKTVYIRAELKEDAWPGPAMRDSKVIPGEIALNAVPNSIVIVPKLIKEPSPNIQKEPE